MSLAESLADLFAWVTRDAVYLAQHPAAVQLQHDDDTLDLLPDNTDLRGRGLSNVKIKHGLPGVRVRVVQGSRVLLGFEAGNPDKPYASLWDPGSVEKIMFNGGSTAIARVGDIALCYWPVLDIVGTLNGAPCAFTAAAASPSPAVITSGQPKVLA